MSAPFRLFRLLPVLRSVLWILGAAGGAGATLVLWADPALAQSAGLPPGWPWWVWPIGLFLATTLLGILAVLGGIGGSVLYVPIVSGVAPFIHIDFIRGAGLMMALTGALSAGPGLIRRNLVHVRMAIPMLLVGSTFSILGALLGLALPVQVVQLALGLAILGVSVLMIATRHQQPHTGGRPDPLARLLGLRTETWDDVRQANVAWEPRRMVLGLTLFGGVGLMSGMFGLGAGWATVPVLSLLMGVPIKIAVGTSFFLLAMTNSSVWVYLNKGAILPLLVVPTVLGMMLGSRLGARLLYLSRPTLVRWVVIGLLIVAGLRALTRGLGW